MSHSRAGTPGSASVATTRDAAADSRFLARSLTARSAPTTPARTVNAARLVVTTAMTVTTTALARSTTNDIRGWSSRCSSQTAAGPASR